MSWAGKRRAVYGGGVLLFIILVVGIPLFIFLYDAPTCSDGVKNHGEVEIDRGGPCPLLADSQVQEEGILWARAFEVSSGVYNAVAYIDNPNFNAGVRNIAYSVKLFDVNNILVAERKGRTYISPNGVTPIFEGGIIAGERVPTRTFFSFLEAPLWESVTEPQERLVIGTRTVSNEDTLPRIDAVVKNISFEAVDDIEVVATIFNSSGNAIASSRTTLGVLAGQAEQSIVFTWPQPFSAPVSRIEIIPRTPFNN